ncbi:TetR family transcriptional regulator [Nocardioides psychrotolerans]|uniref:Transcriptional regulator, TetR family n=1 Tax=Nocardioides psychrotolerans TaxID=1005945 RepID=A0A1I3PAT3_9ACTN|nr:TetR/AcrR family transcriptional regulator [Nocardioides psychrotolerans]GEP39629.1 TetR family transcriptional regulator [Nocardioides psychrotolerans]SFJ18531.1 transcriptional regulator, TetR family [Nocardioides psychrotolerans]
MTVGRKQRRERLLAAAQKAVAEHGADVRLKDVAQVAGLTSGAILYHFPDIQTLLVEANRAGMERFYDQRLKAISGSITPDRKLVVTIASGLPRDSEDEAVRLLCELGGAAGRYPRYAAMLTSLYDRQVAMYQVLLEDGAASGVFTLAQPSQTVARNIVALEDAYGYRMVARHSTIDHAAATQLILDYARLATGHLLDQPDPVGLDHTVPDAGVPA